MKTSKLWWRYEPTAVQKASYFEFQEVLGPESCYAYRPMNSFLLTDRMLAFQKDSLKQYDIQVLQTEAFNPLYKISLNLELGIIHYVLDNDQKDLAKLVN